MCLSPLILAPFFFMEGLWVEGEIPGQWVREELWTTPQRPLTLGSLVHLVLQGSLY